MKSLFNSATTNLVSDSEDFLTWTTTDFETKTQIAIEATLADEAVLKNTYNCV
jgi:hypothetical protein